MTKYPWRGSAATHRNLTLVLRGLAVALLLLYVSLLVGARFT